jgi:hypothetical protein
MDSKEKRIEYFISVSTIIIGSLFSFLLTVIFVLFFYIFFANRLIGLLT